MKINSLKVAVVVMAFAVLSSLAVTPTAALTLTYSDSTWEYLTATGPSLTKAGNTEIYTITGKLSANASGAVHIKLWIINASQIYKVLLDDDALLNGNYLVNSSFAKSYTVVIPADVENNKYIYATVDAGTRHFSNFTISLVQNPVYPDLQSQLAQSQSQASAYAAQVKDLQNQTSLLQSQLDSAQGDNAALQLQVQELEGNKTELQTQADGLQANNTRLETENNDLLAQIGILQNSTSLQPQTANVTEYEAVISRLSNQTQTLQTQLTDAQAQGSSKALFMYLGFGAAAALGAMVGVLVFRGKRKKKASAPSLTQQHR